VVHAAGGDEEVVVVLVVVGAAGDLGARPDAIRPRRKKR
jgi:hypothetical protein